MFYYFTRLCLLVQCFREPLVGSPPDTPPGDTQASVGEADTLLYGPCLLPLPGSVQVSIDEAVPKNLSG